MDMRAFLGLSKLTLLTLFNHFWRKTKYSYGTNYWWKFQEALINNQSSSFNFYRFYEKKNYVTFDASELVVAEVAVLSQQMMIISLSFMRLEMRIQPKRIIQLQNVNSYLSCGLSGQRKNCSSRLIRWRILYMILKYLFDITPEN